MDDLYREMIVDRYKNPRMKGTLDPYTYRYEDHNHYVGSDVVYLETDEWGDR